MSRKIQKQKKRSNGTDGGVLKQKRRLTCTRAGSTTSGEFRKGSKGGGEGRFMGHVTVAPQSHETIVGADQEERHVEVVDHVEGRNAHTAGVVIDLDKGASERERERLVNILKYVTKGTRSMGPGNQK